MTKVTIRIFTLLLTLSFLQSCASFKKIDPLPRNIIETANKDKTKTPYAKILVRWRNYPLITASSTIGYTDKEKEEIKPLEVPYEDYMKFKKNLIKAFKETGLYDEKTGTGTVKVDLTSFGRWTYGELTKNFLTETSFIYILPRSLTVNYYMTLEISQNGETKTAQETSSIKTTFHLLLFPLYPLASFNGSEKAVLKNLIWKAVTNSYALQKNLEIVKPKFDDFDEKIPEKPELKKKQDY